MQVSWRHCDITLRVAYGYVCSPIKSLDSLPSVRSTCQVEILFISELRSLGTRWFPIKLVPLGPSKLLFIQSLINTFTCLYSPLTSDWLPYQHTADMTQSLCSSSERKGPLLGQDLPTLRMIFHYYHEDHIRICLIVVLQETIHTALVTVIFTSMFPLRMSTQQSS